ncbi:lipase secretion chaperone [Acinetobacter sp. AOR15_HL]|uniref:lipase secretion chaperone n=1 Tax=unclassified Acinetobacter TaxID=196816 RepID=UPI0022EAC2E6|nr:MULTISPECIES: lipase secretion chaperone [unclassified Acinetobacter]MDA3558848.1 lipase secretion chaperone [Acinetobacter sp. AOR15_HL]MDA3572561.1 lipase secretion chaperone [Acinetobacter sp. AOR14_HL]
MQGMQKKVLWCVLGFFILGLIACVYWLSPDSKNTSAQMSESKAQNLASSLHTDHSSLNEDAYHSKSQQDTEVNCQLKIDSSQHLVVNSQTRDCFEYFITQYGENDLEQIKIHFGKFIQGQYLEPARSQIMDLWTRYLKYREQLAQIQAPSAKQQDKNYFQKIFNSIQDIRKRFFSASEIEGLFSSEDIYQNYTLDRMQILEDSSLSEIEKARKLKERFEELPEDWQHNLQELSKLDDLHTLTKQIKARNGSAEELRQMRTTLVGAEATQRLETLDTQRNAWQQRVTSYLDSRDEIIKSNMSDSAKNQAIQQLRQQQFNSSQEQLRLRTFETVHDQGGELPFNY